MPTRLLPKWLEDTNFSGPLLGSKHVASLADAREARGRARAAHAKRRLRMKRMTWIPRPTTPSTHQTRSPCKSIRTGSGNVFRLSSYADACNSLEIADPANPALTYNGGDVRLLVHQAQSIDWLLQTDMKDTAKGAILADDMGLGKTTTVYGYLAARAYCLDQVEPSVAESRPAVSKSTGPAVVLFTSAGVKAFVDEYFNRNIESLDI
jgi:hypothetical protein